MSITDELRKYAQDWRENPNLMDDLDAGDIDGLLGDFEHIADRIDAEHEGICYDYQREHDDWVYIRDTCWVELPKDADGEYIHVGDVMEACYDYQLSSTPEVRAMRYGEGGWEVYDRLGDRYHPSSLRHHHAPTVEDVLCDLLNEYRENECTLEEARLSEYATRLRLAEGEDA